jgi:hypothetical protein
MTIPRMEAIAARWSKVPPLSVSVAMVAAALGVKLEQPAPDQTGAPAGEQQGDLQGLVDVFGLSEGKPEWLTT